MKLVKKATALLAVCALAIGMTACGTSSGSKIVAENENTKITMGAYAYCMYSAYYQASYYVPDATQSILSQEINGQSAEDLSLIHIYGAGLYCKTMQCFHRPYEI